MRLLAIFIISCYTMLVIHQPAVSKSICRVVCKAAQHKQQTDRSSEVNESIKPYDGFFIKI